jgi:hypothetical protein
VAAAELTIAAARDAWQRALDVLADLNHPDIEAVRAKLQRRFP